MQQLALDSLANEQARATWNNRACGVLSAEENADAGSIAFFNQMVERRYGQIDSWVPAVLNFPSMAGKEVLEIGHGMGCDLVHAAKAGAIVHGVDITPNHHEIAKKHLAVNGLEGDLRLCDASELPYASNSMDVVYSMGVLHHTDDTIRCISEAYRVLKPGGTFIMALYHFWSLNHFWLLLKRGIWNGDLKRLGYDGLLSLVEGGADGITIKPLVKLYSRRMVRTILADFSATKIQICGIQERIPIVSGMLPSAARTWLEKHWGWYIVSHATK